MTLPKKGCDLHEPWSLNQVRPPYFWIFRTPSPLSAVLFVGSSASHPSPLSVEVLYGSPPIKLVLPPSLRLRPISSQQKSLKEIREEREGAKCSLLCDRKRPLCSPFHAPPPPLPPPPTLLASPTRRRPQEDHNIYSSPSASRGRAVSDL